MSAMCCVRVCEVDDVGVCEVDDVGVCEVDDVGSPAPAPQLFESLSVLARNGFLSCN